MEPQLPTSFIPKRPITNDVVSTPTRNRTVGLLSLLTGVIVVATAVSFAGTYLYEKSLASKKTRLEQQINDAKSGIGSDFLSDMKRLNARISGVKTLLGGHIVISPIFEALEATTLRSVQYKRFGYEFKLDATTKAQVVQVELDGTAKTYSTIALQSDAFAQSSLIKNPVFSSLTVDDKTGTIGFKLLFDVAPADLSFQSFIDAKAKASGISPLSTAPFTTTPDPLTP